MVQKRLTTQYPNFDFLGEETFKQGQELSDEPTFVCDPIDGTLNFIHGFPNTAISLALTVAKKPVVGVVYNPFRKDLFTAIKGGGAFLTRANGSRIALPVKQNPDPLESLNDCLVAVEWGNERLGPNWELRSSVAIKLLSSKVIGGAMAHSVRSNGSAALDFCYVAAGWFDMFWEGGCWIWDVCAGWLIVEEAGGIVVGASPGEWEPTLEGRSYFPVRAAPRGQRKVVEEMWSCMGGRRFVFK
jgi:myo-inositol-1(or 4)-monophosphatase